MTLRAGSTAPLQGEPQDLTPAVQKAFSMGPAGLGLSAPAPKVEAAPKQAVSLVRAPSQPAPPAPSQGRN
jgi:hypothetical protein